jgi:hypothetical protein
MPTIANKEVARVFNTYPPAIRARLMILRKLILDVAAATDGVGDIEETLKWGEPAYLTTQTGSGSTIRLGWKKNHPSRYAMYFHCQTNLIETIRSLFPNDFRFAGNRAIVFEENNEVPTDALTFCIAAALTYHIAKKSSRAGKST